MEIHFCLGWLKSGGLNSKTFKLEGARAMFSDYMERISKFALCHVSGIAPETRARKKGTKIWVCDRGTGSKMLSSEALAETLEQFRDSGTRELDIIVGGADGFSKKEIEKLNPDLHWSFGPMTLPHELAAVVASEQIYRAWTIIKHMPYHSGH